MAEQPKHVLSNDQIQRAVAVMKDYLAAPKNPDGRTPMEVQTERDKHRVRLIDAELKPLLGGYLSGHIDLANFKTKVDGINKRNAFWGFKGIKGQMFFNMVVNVAHDKHECDSELKAAIKAPTNEGTASTRIEAFANYVKRIGDQHVELGGTGAGRPKLGSIPFFLSYFWQIQERNIWPVFYTNSVNVMTDMNLWVPTGEPSADYLTYKHIHEELGRVFTHESKKEFGLYEVEHVFWFKGGNPYGGNKPVVKGQVPKDSHNEQVIVSDQETLVSLLERYVPPIVELLPRMARNESSMREATRASGTSLERAFEKSIHAAFTMLGYETKLLGQGQGRVPDGQALSLDDSYAILWDAKVRTEQYSMGTDDRAVKEYITTQSRELKRRRRLRNIYYLLVSSEFADDFDDSIRSIKMETDVNEVCLVQADALVAMVDAKMRSPREIGLGPDSLQRLFTVGGVVSADLVRETLG